MAGWMIMECSWLFVLVGALSVAAALGARAERTWHARRRLVACKRSPGALGVSLCRHAGRAPDAAGCGSPASAARTVLNLRAGLRQRLGPWRFSQVVHLRGSVSVRRHRALDRAVGHRQLTFEILKILRAT